MCAVPSSATAISGCDPAARVNGAAAAVPVIPAQSATRMTMDRQVDANKARTPYRQPYRRGRVPLLRVAERGRLLGHPGADGLELVGRAHEADLQVGLELQRVGGGS